MQELFLPALSLKKKPCIYMCRQFVGLTHLLVGDV